MQVLLFGTFWNYFPQNIFILLLVESAGVKHTDTEGRVYTSGNIDL